MAVVLDKKKLAHKIWKRTNGTVPKAYIYDIITVVCDQIVEKISEDGTFSVENFGTFSPYLFHGHNGVNISTGKLQWIKPFRALRFLPHAVFSRLARDKDSKREENS